eukprot:scaffold1268_cov102-Isochrysis_galbana.AAC.3
MELGDHKKCPGSLQATQGVEWPEAARNAGIYHRRASHGHQSFRTICVARGLKLPLLPPRLLSQQLVRSADQLIDIEPRVRGDAQDAPVRHHRPERLERRWHTRRHVWQVYFAQDDDLRRARQPWRVLLELPVDGDEISRWRLGLAAHQEGEPEPLALARALDEPRDVQQKHLATARPVRFAHAEIGHERREGVVRHLIGRAAAGKG